MKKKPHINAQRGKERKGSTLRFATIGTSWITEAFISAAKKQGWELAGVYSRDRDRAEAFRLKHGAGAAFHSLETLACSDAFETVYVASPNAMHFDQCLALIRAGKHVFCEKPMTTTGAEAQTLFAEAESRGVLAAEAIMSVHTPAFRALREAIGQIGAIAGANFVFWQRSSKYDAFCAGKNPNIFNPALHTGSLMDIGVYAVYLAAALFGRPEETLSVSHFLPGGSDGSGAALLRYDTFTASLTWSKTAQSTAPSEIAGDGGSITIESVSQLTGIDLHTPAGVRNLSPAALDRDTVMGAECAFFEEAVRLDGGEAYQKAKRLNLLVRELTDTIRCQNGFPF